MSKNIKKCGCGEKEFLQVLIVFKRPYVHCVNCGNRGAAMLIEEKSIDFWNRLSRFDGDNNE